MTFNSRAVATVTVVFPESAVLPWHLHDNQSISFIIPSTLAGKARPRAGRAQWKPGRGLEALVAEAPSCSPLSLPRFPYGLWIHHHFLGSGFKFQLCH